MWFSEGAESAKRVGGVVSCDIWLILRMCVEKQSSQDMERHLTDELAEKDTSQPQASISPSFSLSLR